LGSRMAKVGHREKVRRGALHPQSIFTSEECTARKTLWSVNIILHRALT